MTRDAANYIWVCFAAHSDHSGHTVDGSDRVVHGTLGEERERVVGSSAEVVCDEATAERQGREVG